jgi:Cd2+/Zn2+-exporting ATPase
VQLNLQGRTERTQLKAMTPSTHTDNWVESLVQFLRTRPEISAVRVDPAAHKVSVATVAQIDPAALERQLAATITAVEAKWAKGQPRLAQAGFLLRQEGDATVIARETGATAEKLWLWREMTWPEITAEPTLESQEWRTLALLAAACGVLGVSAALVQQFAPGIPWLSRILFGLALGAGAWDAAADTRENLREGKIDIHFLMLAVAVGAVFINALGEAVLLLFLFSSAGAMEEYALDRTQREVGALLKTSPKRATLVRPDGSEQDVPVGELQVGQRVRVKPGEAFAADGTVVQGRSASDESNLTGEAAPVEKATGDQVFSGTMNLWGAVDFEVARLPAESTLQKVIRLIQTAQQLKAPSERFTDRFGTGYTYAVIGGSLLMFLVWWLGFHLPPFTNTPETRSAFYRAMTLMVVASPCALVLSIPSAILAAIAWGARHGVLFRGGAAIENLAKVNVVALDKTGTLTTGEPAVVGYESFPPGREQEIMELAYALEAKSEHPLARAIVRDARARGVRAVEISDFQSIVGAGVRGRLGGALALLGRRELLETGPLAQWAGKLPPAPAELSEIWVVGKDVLGRVLLRDQIRGESKAVLAELKRLGIHTVMLTGDRRLAAEAVAQELGLGEVRANLTPEQKVEAIMELRRGAGGRTVAMVGDGVNDAPCLAAADIGVAMGARGSDAALEQAEVILMHDRIENFLAAERLSRRARRIIRQNLTLSLGVVVGMVIATVLGAVPLGLGVTAHEGSTLVVCLNSLRLLVGRNR